MQRIRRVMSLLVVIIFAFSIGYFMALQPSTESVNAQNDDANSKVDTFIEAYDVLNARYIDPLDQDMLIEAAIEGMIDSIGDPNSNFMTQEEYQDWNLSLSGEFEGIGATVRQNDDTGALEIVAPLEDSPAERAGLQPGDQIIAVGGEDITELSQSEIVSRVRGPAGTPVQLTIFRPADPLALDSEESTFDLTIIRARLELPDVDYEVLDNNIGYIQMHQFSDETTQHLRDALVEMDADNLDGLVLDLRNNPGGYLSTSLQVISQFVDEGPILIEQLPGGEERIYEALGNALATNVPLAIIVNEGSASASELVAGSLRDRERAIIVGEATFGKNTVQTIQQLSGGNGALRITIARWVTPDGFSSEPDGIIPDIEITLDLDADEDEDAQLDAAIRALNGMLREQLYVPNAIG